MRCNEYVLDIILRETGWVLQLGLLRDFILFMVPCLHLSLSYNSVKFLRARSKQTFFSVCTESLSKLDLASNQCTVDEFNDSDDLGSVLVGLDAYQKYVVRIHYEDDHQLLGFKSSYTTYSSWLLMVARRANVPGIVLVDVQVGISVCLEADLPFDPKRLEDLSQL